MSYAKVQGISIKYDTFGLRSGRPLLLIMGLGAQMTRWPEAFCELLAADDHFVIRFDNRDVGLSEKFDAAGIPDMGAMLSRLMQGQPVEAPYTLSDMARDAIGLLDHLDIPEAHVCGASMGGMIAQTLAIEYPSRLRSLISIMSHTGNPDLPAATPQAQAALLSRPGRTLEEVLSRAVQVARAIGSPAYPAPEADLRQRAQADFERCFHPEGAARHMAAVAASGNRRPALADVSIPTLVLHGEDDPLVRLAGGIDTRDAIPGAVMKTYPGMGHDLPEPLWPEITEDIGRHTRKHDR